MKRKDLVVGADYYHESSSSRWDETSRRDITNRTGHNRVRLLGTELYTQNRFRYRGGPGVGPAYLPATKYASGTYVRVLHLARETPEGGDYRRRQDEEGYVTLASLRGKWDDVVRSTTDTLAARDARERERNENRDRENDRLAEIAARAHAVGLEVAPTPGPIQRERQFAIKEADLVDFLNALTGTLESLTLVEH